MAEIKRIKPKAVGNASCDDPSIDNTIEVVNVSISDQLTELIIDAFTCGIFTEVRIWVGDAYINDEEPIRISGDKLEAVQNPCNGDSPPLGCSPETADKSGLTLALSAADLNIKGEIIDDFIVVGLTSKRCWTQPVNPNDPLGEQVECRNKLPGEDEIDESLEEQVIKIDEARVGVASFATIYPALIHKIMAISDGCTACSDMNDALTMDMLIKAVVIYLTVDRVEEAWEAYAKSRQMSQDYEDLFRKGPTACQTFGGIGCWMIDKNFIVSASRVVKEA